MTSTAAKAEPAAAATAAPATPATLATLVTGAPVPRPTLAKTFYAMVARDCRVLRRNWINTFIRSVMQPLLFIFVFTYVLPTIGGGIRFSAIRGGLSFATILVPGLMASMMLAQGVLAVTYPLVMEFSWLRSIEDRALAPVPIRLLAIEKIIFGSLQSVLGGLIVFPIVLLVHAPGESPHVHVRNWAVLVVILLASALLAASLGLLLGTILDPRKMQMLMAVALLATMLGCVYYPWHALGKIPWLQDAVLANPMVYMSEGLRSMLTPRLDHLPLPAIFPVLIGGIAVVGYLGVRTFTRRVIN